MKLYLNEEKTNIDPFPHNCIQLGQDSNDQDHCGSKNNSESSHFHSKKGEYETEEFVFQIS